MSVYIARSDLSQDVLEMRKCSRVNAILPMFHVAILIFNGTKVFQALLSNRAAHIVLVFLSPFFNNRTQSFCLIIDSSLPFHSWPPCNSESKEYDASAFCGAYGEKGIVELLRELNALSYFERSDYLVTKCGVLMMSLFVFFTTTMSVSFTLRETQTRMLKFTVQLQHHARHRLPTFQLIFVHVIESLVFVPIMIGILFFLFEFYDDQLLAFMVLILVWLCELFTLISVRTPISMKFFPRFFLLYFLVFHIYFFSYTFGFSYLALSTTAAFMQHLILYFWNRFEVPALQRFIQHRRSQFPQHPDFHITSSTILASTLHITRLNTRNPDPVNTDMTAGPEPRVPNPVMPANGAAELSGLQGRAENNNSGRVGNPIQMVAGQPDLRQAETGGANPGNMNSFSSLLLWILGGASSEGLNSFLSIFRDVRDQGQVYAEAPRQENRIT
ncbi:hypothetical protein Acr_05g0000640 [Actinidia rufa]|uniref:Uncharacterized protein n=1 Tax=Actinidia rufa TaxID=165716 RepID=A0A7J0EIX7_9ERIC|nr:hypothetical protein Acr_05g0000640 [Actinidia rufa]